MQCVPPFDVLGINKATTTLIAQSKQGRSRCHHSPLISDQVLSGKVLEWLSMQMEAAVKTCECTERKILYIT